MPRHEQSRDGGMALLLVIWILSLLSAIAAHLTLDVRTALDSTRTFLDMSQARAQADGGVWAAIALLLDGETSSRLDGTPQRLTTTAPNVTVAIEDERGKLDINVVNEARLRQLFENVGLEQADVLARRVAEYRAATALPEPAHAPRRAFQTKQDIRQAAGLSLAAYQRVAPYITVYSDDWRINPVAAKREVLSALPEVTAAMAQQYVVWRTGYSKDQVALRLASPPAIASQAVWGRPRVVSISSTAQLDSGFTYIRKAVVDISGDSPPFRILVWSQSE